MNAVQCSAVGGRGLQSIELTPTLAIIAVNSQYRDTETVVKVVQTAAPHLPPTPPPPPVWGGDYYQLVFRHRAGETWDHLTRLVVTAGAWS